MKIIYSIAFTILICFSSTAQWIPAGCPGARLVASNTEWLFAAHHTVLRSNDGGLTWSTNLVGLPQATSNRVVCLMATDSIVFAGLGPAGLYFSNTNGAQWTMATGLPSGSVRSLARIGNTWYAAIDQNGVYKTSGSSFLNWEPMNAGLPVNTPGKQFVSIIAQGNALFVGVTGAGIYYFDTEAMVGSDWFLSSQNVSSGPPVNQPTTLAFVPNRTIPSGFSGSFLYAGTANKGVYDSGDGGAMWDPANPVTSFQKVYTLYEYNNALLAATDAGTFVNLFYNLWEQIPGINGRSFTVQNGFLYFADTINVFKGTLPPQFTASKSASIQSSPEVYPVPASDWAIVGNLSGTTNTSIRLTDPFGKTIWCKNNWNETEYGRLFLPVSALPNGLYLVQISGPGIQPKSVKLQVQH